MIESKALNICDACYIFFNYYKNLKKESYIKSDDLIDDYYDNDYYYKDAVDGNRHYLYVITGVKLELQNTQYTKEEWRVLSS